MRDFTVSDNFEANSSNALKENPQEVHLRSVAIIKLEICLATGFAESIETKGRDIGKACRFSMEFYVASAIVKVQSDPNEAINFLIEFGPGADLSRRNQIT